MDSKAIEDIEVTQIVEQATEGPEKKKQKLGRRPNGEDKFDLHAFIKKERSGMYR